MFNYVVYNSSKGLYVESLASTLVFTKKKNKAPWLFNEYLEARNFCKDIDADVVLAIEKFGIDYIIREAWCPKQGAVANHWLDSLIGQNAPLTKLESLLT